MLYPSFGGTALTYPTLPLALDVAPTIAVHVLLSCCVKVNVVPSALVAVNVVPERVIFLIASSLAALPDSTVETRLVRAELTPPTKSHCVPLYLKE